MWLIEKVNDGSVSSLGNREKYRMGPVRTQIRISGAGMKYQRLHCMIKKSAGNVDMC